MKWKNSAKQGMAALLSALLLVSMTGCGSSQSDTQEAQKGNVAEYDAGKEIIFFSPASITPDSVEWKESAAGAAIELTEKLVPEYTFTYRNFTAENATMTYDEACMERLREEMDDDILQLNPDVIINAGREGLLADLSDLEGVDKLLPAIRAGVTIDGKVVSMPREYIGYGLIVNNDILKEHGLEIPQTLDDFLACCEKLKADGMETPMAANRWWLECFVLTQGFTDFYQSDNMEQLIADLNDGTTKMSEYMRPGFEFLKTCMDKGYINAELANSYEAFDERDAFLGHESAFMTSFTGAVTGAGRKLNNYDFDLRVTGFPTVDGQVALSTVTGFSVPAANKKMDDVKKVLEAYCSAEVTETFCEKSGNFAARSDVTTSTESLPVLADFMDDVNAGRMVAASNPAVNMEIWGNTCTVVRDLLDGASVDECMATIDQLQADANAAVQK